MIKKVESIEDALRRLVAGEYLYDEDGIAVNLRDTKVGELDQLYRRTSDHNTEVEA